jgi:hypothetical protein
MSDENSFIVEYSQLGGLLRLLLQGAQCRLDPQRHAAETEA